MQALTDGHVYADMRQSAPGAAITADALGARNADRLSESAWDAGSWPEDGHVSRQAVRRAAAALMNQPSRLSLEKPTKACMLICSDPLDQHVT